MSGSVRIVTSGQTLTVNITRPDGSAAVAYTDGTLASSLAFPQTITTDTSYYFNAPCGLIVSTKLNGTEIAGGLNSTISVFVEDGQQRVVDPTSRTPDVFGVAGKFTVGEKLRRAALRASGRNSIELGLASVLPTISEGTAVLDATLTKAYRVSAGAASSFRFTGGIPQLYGGVYYTMPVVTMPSGGGGNTPGATNKNNYMAAVEFVSDAPKVQIRHLGMSLTFQVEVDDQTISSAGLNTSTASGTQYTLLDYSADTARTVRRYRIEYQQGFGFDGINVDPRYSIWAPPTDNPVTVAFVGDSIETGTGNTLANGASSKVCGKLLGWADVRQIAFGGTGFSNPGTLNKFGAALRVSDAVASNPDLLVVVGSQNDDSYASTSLFSDALSTFQSYRAALPNVPIVVLGADAGSSGPSAGRLLTEATVKAAFAAWNDPNSFYIPVSNDATGSWFSGTGTTGALTGSGNRDRYGFDTAHPNDAGHNFRGRRLAAAFRSIVLPYIA